jgi:hypothetical protein
MPRWGIVLLKRMLLLPHRARNYNAFVLVLMWRNDEVHASLDSKARVRIETLLRLAEWGESANKGCQVFF